MYSAVSLFADWRVIKLSANTAAAIERRYWAAQDLELNALSYYRVEARGYLCDESHENIISGSHLCP